MKNLPYSLLAALTAAALSGPTLSAQDIIFQENFNDVPEWELPLTTANGGPWMIVDPGSGGSIWVQADTTDRFGYGTTNHFLQIQNVSDFSLRSPLLEDSSDVVTLSFDFIDRQATGFGNERLAVQLFASVPLDDLGEPAPRNDDRAHIFGLQGAGGAQGTIRTNAASYDRQTRSRADVVLNNSGATITYEGPHGQPRELGHGLADAWINGVLYATNYVFARGEAGEGVIDVLAFEALPGDQFNIDVDNITLFAGAHVLAPVVDGFEPEAPPAIPTGTVLLEDDFEGAPLGPVTASHPGPWTSVNPPGLGVLNVVQDDQNRFGQGTDNQILRMDVARGLCIACRRGVS